MKTTKMKLLSFALLSLAAAFPTQVQSDEPKRDGDWMVVKDSVSGGTTMTMDMTLSPKAESSPALRYRFIADGFDLLEENSAVYYLKAMGFLEQSSALELLMKERAQTRKIVEETGKDYYSLPPHVWLDQTPAELPLDKVKEYLSLTRFQTRDLAEAAKRKFFSMERNIRSVEEPTMVLLAEIQVMRELARNQRLRCRVAIAEGRVDDAIAILGQQFALARHVDQDIFVVSSLVGAAIAGIAWEDALHLTQHPDCPNLYWAVASLPTPLITMENAMDFERQFFLEQVKVLREVDETPREESYWKTFIEKFEKQVTHLESWHDDGTLNHTRMNQAMIEAMIEASYPASKLYLVEETGIDSKIVDSYPKAQAVFLAMKRLHEVLRDKSFQWRYVPYANAIASAEFQNLEKEMTSMASKLGKAGEIALSLLPSGTNLFQAKRRIVDKLVLLQTVESIRDHASAHQGKLPSTLADLRLPIPQDSLMVKSMQYELQEDYAVLSIQDWNKLKWQLTLKMRSE